MIWGSDILQEIRQKLSAVCWVTLESWQHFWQVSNLRKYVICVILILIRANLSKKSLPKLLVDDKRSFLYSQSQSNDKYLPVYDQILLYLMLIKSMFLFFGLFIFSRHHGGTAGWAGYRQHRFRSFIWSNVALVDRWSDLCRDICW